MKTHFPRVALLACALFAGALLLAGCGDGYEGDTYSDSEGVISIEFKSGNRAYFQMGDLGTRELEYEVDGDRVILKGPDGNQVLTRKEDGSLDGGMMLGTLKKKG